MSKTNKHPYDEFEEEIERMLESLSESDDEEDFGYFSASYPRRNSVFGDDLDDAGDTPPPIPQEAKCRHERTEKRYLINSAYYVCLNCKADLGNKAPDDKQKK